MVYHKIYSLISTTKPWIIGVYKNWLPNFLGSTQYRSYYQPKTVTTTHYLVELKVSRLH